MSNFHLFALYIIYLNLILIQMKVSNSGNHKNSKIHSKTIEYIRNSYNNKIHKDKDRLY